MNTRERLDQFFSSWLGRVEMPGAIARGEESLLTTVPEAVAERYPHIPQERLGEFSYACRVFSIAAVKLDDVIDYVSHVPENVKLTAPEMLAVLLEPYVSFARLFDAKAPFWDHLRRYIVEFIDSMRDELRYSAAEAWRSLDSQACLELLGRKLGLIRIIAAGVCELAGNYEEIDALETMLVQFFVSYQMLDDLQDWREDVRDGNISLLLRQCSQEPPGEGDVAEIARTMFAQGHAEMVLGVALDQAREALDTARRLEVNHLGRILLEHIYRVEAIRSSLQRSIAEVRTTPRPAVSA